MGSYLQQLANRGHVLVTTFTEDYIFILKAYIAI